MSKGEPLPLVTQPRSAPERTCRWTTLTAPHFTPGPASPAATGDITL